MGLLDSLQFWKDDDEAVNRDHPVRGCFTPPPGLPTDDAVRKIVDRSLDGCQVDPER